MRLDNFLECFFPDEAEPVFIRGFSPKELPYEMRGSVYGRRTTRKDITANKELQSELITLNKTHGLYFSPNSGGFKESEITRFNAVFCEIDDRPLEDQHETYNYSPLPPSIQIETKKSVHAYWLLSETISKDKWVNIQLGLINHFRSDAGIKNPNRVMRLPFFSHVSWDGTYQYKKVEIHTFRAEQRFTAEALSDAFPLIIPPSSGNETTTKSNEVAFSSSMEEFSEELRRRIKSHDSYRTETDGEHGTAQGLCHNAAYGKTAIMLNLRTGAVFCHAGCSFWTIARAFGLERPVFSLNLGHDIKSLRTKRTAQLSETGRRLFNYVYKHD